MKDTNVRNQVVSTFKDLILSAATTVIGEGLEDEKIQAVINNVADMVRRNEVVDLSMVDVEVTKDDNEETMVRGKNFFTALLLSGIYVPPKQTLKSSAYLSTEGIHLWLKDEKYIFVPLSAVLTEATVELNEDK